MTECQQSTDAPVCLLQPAGGHIKTQQAIQWRRGRPQAWAWGVLAPLPPPQKKNVIVFFVH